jgi:hypothetical protein
MGQDRMDAHDLRASRERWKEETDARTSAAIDAHNAKHLAADATWLADLLHDHAARGDARARRMLVALAATLARCGATVKPRMWPKITDPERADELAAILAGDDE